MKNYALITTALLTTMGTLLLGLTISSPAAAQDALTGTLPNPAGMPSAAQPVFQPATAMPIAATGPASTAPVATTTTTTTTVVPTPSPVPSAQLPVHNATAPAASASIVPVTPASTVNPIPSIPAIGGAAPNSALTTSPATPQIVQDAVTRLQKVDQINLDDMIRAQDAINRLDLLLEIEKRQSELKKIRDERTKPAASNLLGSAIPASALNLPKLSVPTPSDAATPIKPIKASAAPSSSGDSDKYSIKRISGADGRYLAVISLEDNSSQTVRAGDKLPDGSLVKAINLTSVSLFKDKKSKTLTIPTDSYIVRESGSLTE